ncbi:UDP-glucuronosyltransferase [Sergentomyia squamirostris]
MKNHFSVGLFVKLLCCCLSTVGSAVDGGQSRGNILCLMGVPSPSHHIWNRSLMLELVRSGFNLTVLTVEMEESQPGLHFILMEDVYETVQREWNTGSGDLDLSRKNAWSIVSETYEFYHFVSQKLVQTNGFRKLLAYPDTFRFNAVIHDFSLGQVMLGFVQKFGSPPLISVSPFGIPPHTFSVSGQTLLTLHSSHFATGFPTNLTTITDKLTNIATHLWDFVYRKMIFMRKENSLAGEFFPGVSELDLTRIEKETTLILVNWVSLHDGGVILPAHVHDVGGIHVTREGWLPSELEHFLKTSSKPVIYFALGSNMRSDLLGSKIIEKFVSAFRKLDQFTVIWKYEGRRPNHWPENIITVEWIDQNKILENPKVVLFITHGGLLSIQEAAWNGIPILGIPLFMDQHSNVARAISRGLGLKINNATSIDENSSLD